MQVVPITSTEIKERIHQTYRMGYIKDVILPRVSHTASLLASDSKRGGLLAETVSRSIVAARRCCVTEASGVGGCCA